MIYPLMTFSITNVITDTFDNMKSTRLDGEKEPLQGDLTFSGIIIYNIMIKGMERGHFILHTKQSVTWSVCT